ncbi:hypothetical protein MASR2M74_13120 [Paracoccaceae bacterium]
MPRTHGSVPASRIAATQHSCYLSVREEMQKGKTMCILVPQKAAALEVPGLAYYTEAPAVPAAPLPAPRVARKMVALDQMYAYYGTE